MTKMDRIPVKLTTRELKRSGPVHPSILNMFLHGKSFYKHNHVLTEQSSRQHDYTVEIGETVRHNDGASSYTDGLIRPEQQSYLFGKTSTIM